MALRMHGAHLVNLTNPTYMPTRTQKTLSAQRSIFNGDHMLQGRQQIAARCSRDYKVVQLEAAAHLGVLF